MKVSSITDIPRNVSQGEKDNFGITPYENGLAEFIQYSSTPVTVALQGEWGSGKTSLMNSLQKSLTDEKEGAYYGIWLNTWEYALMKDASNILMDIITNLICDISHLAHVDESKTKKIINTLWGVSKNTMTFAAKKAADQVIDGSSQLIDDLLSDGTHKSIGKVRDELEEVIATCIAKGNKKGIIFFIDDLDRIDPPIAVQLLELLKNIFTLKNCIFVLAIDYDVVIKGLDPKFGAFSSENEREFRSFFDKIIQVPFSMPVANYQLVHFLKDGLSLINYLTPEQLQDETLIKDFATFSELTVGTNPRALKRLLNSLSLINCINVQKNMSKQEMVHLNDPFSALVNFVLVSIQIAYPLVYRVLVRYPEFDRWDEKVAIQMNLPPLSQECKNKISKSEEFDEEWEQVLFRLCESDFYLKKRALHLSNLLNKLRHIIRDRGESIEDVVDSIISLSSVTNLEAFDKPTIDYHRGSFLKKLRSYLIPVLSEQLLGVLVAEAGKRVQTNAYIKIGELVQIRLSSAPSEGKIRLKLSYSRRICSADDGLEASLKTEGKYEAWQSLCHDYNAFLENHSIITGQPLGYWNSKSYGKYEVSLHHFLMLSSVDDFYTDTNIQMLADYIAHLYPLLERLYRLSST